MAGSGGSVLPHRPSICLTGAMTPKGTHSTSTEIERKYDVDRQLRLPDLLQIPGVAALEFPGTVTLVAVYFDTDAMDLAQNRIVLRRREGGGDAGWHIKLPAREGRTEMQWPLDVDRDDSNGHGPGRSDVTATTEVPGRVLDPIRTIVRDRPLTPLARITTIRTTVLLLNDEGDAVAELADDDVSASDMRSGVFRKWREWEVELFSAAPDTRKERTILLDAIEAGLLEAGAQPSTSIAKIARALGADALTELTPSAPRSWAGGAKRAKPHAGSAASVVATMRALGARLLAADPRVRADEPQGLRTMAETVQRLQNVLSVYRRLFALDTVEALCADLGEVGSALETASRTEARVVRTQKRLDDLTAPLRDEVAEARLLTETEAARTRARDELRRVLISREYFGLLDQLDSFLLHPAVTPETYESAARDVTKSLKRAVKNLRECTDVALAARASAADSALTEPGEPSALASTDTVPAALQEVHTAARRLRHAAEAVTPGADGGKKYRRLAAAATELSLALSARRDDLEFSEYVTGAATRAHAAGEATFVYGVLAARAEGEHDDAALDLRAAATQIRNLGRKL